MFLYFTSVNFDVMVQPGPSAVKILSALNPGQAAPLIMLSPSLFPVWDEESVMIFTGLSVV